MHQKQAFEGITQAQEKLATLNGTYVLPAGGNINEVRDLLEKVKFSLKIHGAAPQFVLTQALYPTTEGGNELASGKFTVRPAVSSALYVADMKKEFTILAGVDFFDKFIAEMGVWFDQYEYAKRLQDNVTALNDVVSELIAENDVAFNIQFSLGSGLIDASDNHAVVGLSAEVIASLGSLSLFDEQLPTRVEGYKSRILETLLQCTKPYQIVKVKTNFTKDLGIYSRRDLNKLMRQFVSRKIEHVRTGTGYYETDAQFGVIDKQVATDKEVEALEDKNILVVDNENASEKEKEAGKTKIIVSWRVAPFSKAEGTPVKVKLADALKPVKVGA